MANKAINELLNYGATKYWNSNFSGGQTWTKTQDILAGHCYTCAGGYAPYVDTANSIIKWQSYNTFYSSGYCLAHFVEPAPIITRGVLEGVLYGYMLTGNHTQTTSYNFLCSNSGYAGDSEVYDHVRNTTGLSITVCNYGSYYSDQLQVKAYLNNVLIGTIGSIPRNTYYTVKFKMAGGNLYGLVEAGDTRTNTPTYSLISSSVDQSSLTGTDNIVYMSNWITNDQAPYCYGQVNSVSLKNYL